MPRQVDSFRWQKFTHLLAAGATTAAAAREAGISTKAAYSFVSGNQNSSGKAHMWKTEAFDLPAVKPYKTLKPEAKRALEDFALFRLRYFGRQSVPWQVEAAETVVALLRTEEKEYAVINASPGSGKSTLFTHDIPAWLMCRDRTIRCLLGSATISVAKQYSARLRRTLDRRIPLKAEDKKKAAGVASDAKATLIQDFGRFRPVVSDLWRAEEFVIAQPDDIAVEDKEPSCIAYGFDSEFLGGRYDLVVWDDLVTKKNQRTLESRELMQERFADEAENRLEPEGLFLLQGQRISPPDLYHWALQVPDVDPLLEDEEESFYDESGELLPDAPRMYKHVVYKAHYDELCEGAHAENPDHKVDGRPYLEGGCLLDPRRLRWRDLQRKRMRSSSSFQLIYQQEDTDPESTLVQREWIYGGKGPGGIEYIGCLDQDRGIAELPENLAGRVDSVMTVDPSPTRYWAIQWWCYHQNSESRFFMDSIKKKLTADVFLDFNVARGVYTGIAEEWYQRSKSMGHPVQYLIVEQNAAQRFLLQHDYFVRWARDRNIRVIGHETHRNKSDATYGVETIAPHYEFGRVRFPWRGSARTISLKLISEVTGYSLSGDTDVDDQVMAHWFLEWNIPKLFRYRRPPAPPAPRPPWIDKLAKKAS